MIQLTDTHCHIHEAVRANAHDSESQNKWAKLADHDPERLIARAHEADVTRLLCVGTFTEDSELAVDFVQERPCLWASIGIHPHEAKAHLDSPGLLDRFKLLPGQPKVVAVGECGLDYFYQHSPKKAQEEILRFQLDLAAAHNLPLIFHVREAFEDFWPIFDNYPNLRGVVHSFTATERELDEALARGLYIGLNGIMTFTKDEAQLAAARAVPLDKMLLETDAPFLTPAPYRGTICEPKHVRVTAEFLANLRGESLDELAAQTTRNAHELFGI